MSGSLWGRRGAGGRHHDRPLAVAAARRVWFRIQGLEFRAKGSGRNTVSLVPGNAFNGGKPQPQFLICDLAWQVKTFQSLSKEAIRAVVWGPDCSVIMFPPFFSFPDFPPSAEADLKGYVRAGGELKVLPPPTRSIRHRSPRLALCAPPPPPF